MENELSKVVEGLTLAKKVEDLLATAEEERDATLSAILDVSNSMTPENRVTSMKTFVCKNVVANILNDLVHNTDTTYDSLFYHVRNIV